MLDLIESGLAGAREREGVLDLTESVRAGPDRVRSGVTDRRVGERADRADLILTPNLSLTHAHRRVWDEPTELT